MTKEQGRQNRKLYKSPPTMEQITLVKNILQVKYTTLEDIWGIPRDTIKRVRYNGRQLPSKYWHWFFDIVKLYDDYVAKVKKGGMRKRVR